MTASGNEPALEGARTEIRELARAFAERAEPVVRAALTRRLDALLEAHATWFGDLREDAAAAFRASAGEAIDAGAAGVRERLGAEDVWLQPYTAPGVVHRPEHGWEGSLPEFVSGFLKRFSRHDRGPELHGLDDPSNRVWVALLSAARSLDPVLGEFGLAPSSTPDLGGGHYGLAPKTAAQLDPTGELARLWKRYRLVYARYAALSARG